VQRVFWVSDRHQGDNGRWTRIGPKVARPLCLFQLPHPTSTDGPPQVSATPGAPCVCGEQPSHRYPGRSGLVRRHSPAGKTSRRILALRLQSFAPWPGRQVHQGRLILPAREISRSPINSADRFAGDDVATSVTSASWSLSLCRGRVYGCGEFCSIDNCLFQAGARDFLPDQVRVRFRPVIRGGTGRLTAAVSRVS